MPASPEAEHDGGSQGRLHISGGKLAFCSMYNVRSTLVVCMHGGGSQGQRISGHF